MDHQQETTTSATAAGDEPRTTKRVPGKPLRVAIQGVAGAFHEIAARQHFGASIDIVPALSFAELFDIAADATRSDAAVVAIENSIAGSILGNYRLLMNSTLNVAGEVYLGIRQNLLALPGVRISDLAEVHSHPMALAQCADFFRSLPHIRLVETEDTAESAARVARNRTKRIGAIASALAAERYGLHILAAGIETQRENYTRFLVLTRDANKADENGGNKTSVCFTAPHEPGSLARILTLLSAEGANLTKIQSAPLPGRPWEYRFFADLTASSAAMSGILTCLAAHTADLRVLGLYRAADFRIAAPHTARLLQTPNPQTP